MRLSAFGNCVLSVRMPEGSVEAKPFVTLEVRYTDGTGV
jgi:hypothetical protein